MKIKPCCDSGKIYIHYLKFRDAPLQDSFYLDIKNGGDSVLAIQYCPFCGIELEVEE